MSTAGKVLVALILLASLVWVLLTAGVDQLNRNGNQAVAMLTEKVAKLQDDVKKTQVESVKVKDQTHLLQEKMDRELTVINARQNDVERLASNVSEIRSRVGYELATVQRTVEEAQQDLTERTAEVAADQKALEAARSEVKSLKATDEELRKSLASLREEFKKTLNASVSILHQSVK